MFARVSTYRTWPDTVLDQTDATVSRVRGIPGCRGVYLLTSLEDGKALSVTLWETKDALTASREAAAAIRAEGSAEGALQIIDVEEFEVAASSLAG
ncbi:MAG: antibiotic biosynthesis monooxygenase [Ramlibacter sp.]|nr:antibiotic biosynthesis monooxygenase [Cryobacterium sp.]